jgi:hypothetical protein
MSFSPTSGPVGTNVSITGTNFTGATGVSFNGTAATVFSVNSDTSINATVPFGATTGKVAVTTPDGTGLSAGTFTVVAAAGAPKITSVLPGWGRKGSSITINGSNFVGVTSVKLGTVTASFTVNSAAKITAVVPTIATGKYKWSVTTAAGTASSPYLFSVF